MVNWEEILMDPVVQGAIIGAAGAVALAALAGFFKIVLSFRDKKLFDEIKIKIGNHKSDTLEGQHDNIREVISGKVDSIREVIGGKVDSIEKLQNYELKRIFTKVDNIDSVMNKNEGRYENLNLDQRDIRDNVNKLVYDWERTNLENKELRGRVTELEKRNMELEIEKKEPIISLNKSKRRNKSMEL